MTRRFRFFTVTDKSLQLLHLAFHCNASNWQSDTHINSQQWVTNCTQEISFTQKMKNPGWAADWHLTEMFWWQYETVRIKLGSSENVSQAQKIANDSNIPASCCITLQWLNVKNKTLNSHNMPTKSIYKAESWPVIWGPLPEAVWGKLTAYSDWSYYVIHREDNVLCLLFLQPKRYWSRNTN